MRASDLDNVPPDLVTPDPAARIPSTSFVPPNEPHWGAAKDEIPGRGERPSMEAGTGEPGVGGRSARIVAIANQKGGVGKTTTAVNLAAVLGELGLKVLVVDLDPQGNASTGLGIAPETRRHTSYDLFRSQVDARTAAMATAWPGVWTVPSTVDLAGAEVELVAEMARETRLARALDPARPDFDFIFVDCPPSLGLLTVNALSAADELVVPLQCEYFALEGLGLLLRNVGLVQQNVNPKLRLTGIVMTMFDGRTRLADEVVAEVRGHFAAETYDTVIPRSVRLAEAPSYGQPITQYDPASKGAEAYRALARELLASTAEARDPRGPPIPEESGRAIVINVTKQPNSADSLAADASVGVPGRAADEGPLVVPIGAEAGPVGRTVGPVGSLPGGHEPAEKEAWTRDVWPNVSREQGHIEPTDQGHVEPTEGEMP